MTGDAVQLIGLDFGTTTSCATMASARLTRNSVTGRMELDRLHETFRSEMVFTPLRGDALDEPAIEHYLDDWLNAGQVSVPDLFGGGALLTGLTAQKENAAALVRIIRQRLGNALIATADDPCLESWLAFMGSCGDLSREQPQASFINVDIGGGTTNLALGQAGDVRSTGCLFVGARHIRVEPGTYEITHLSTYAIALLKYLKIRKTCGESLTEHEVMAVLDFYIMLLEAAVTGRTEVFNAEIARVHEQVPFRLSENLIEPRIVFSGGVGELIYGSFQGKPWPAVTHFGDLGIDLARRILSSPVLAKDISRCTPAAAGRATVYGLLRYSTEISGSTVYLPNPQLLPLTDVPIYGSLVDTATDAQIRDTLKLAKQSHHGGGVRLFFSSADTMTVQAFGNRLCRLLRETAFPEDHPLVLFVRENVGKTLGHYVTAWGTRARNLIVIDEIAVRDAQYAQIGMQRSQVIPVSFYGLNQ